MQNENYTEVKIKWGLKFINSDLESFLQDQPQKKGETRLKLYLNAT